MPHNSHPFSAADADSAAVNLRVGLALTGLGLAELWLAYYSVGGDLSRAQVDAIVTGDVVDDAHDLLAQALNDRLIDSDLAYRVPFRHELATTAP